MENYFGIYVIFGKQNQCEKMPRAPQALRACPLPRARLEGLWPLRQVVGALLLPQERQYPDKNRVQISAQSELWISGNLRNGERAESESAETEREIQSQRGPRPSASMEAMDQRGNPSPI